MDTHWVLDDSILVAGTVIIGVICNAPICMRNFGTELVDTSFTYMIDIPSLFERTLFFSSTSGPVLISTILLLTDLIFYIS